VQGTVVVGVMTIILFAVVDVGYVLEIFHPIDHVDSLNLTLVQV
jgi:hypothetical protein